MKVLLTGAAGFIGMHAAHRLLSRGDEVIGVDNLNDYYDVALKEARLDRLRAFPNFRFKRIEIGNRDAMDHLFTRVKPERVVHLAAQAGVRYSLKNPQAYMDSNMQGFLNVLEACRRHPVSHLVYASSSSVYGSNTRLPFSEHDSVDHPVSLYAATKKANELMAHSYSHLFQIPTTGLRFFTVYGPWGRPDMSPMLFAQAIQADRAIDVFNHGHMARDFTYIDDIVEGLVRVLDKPATPDTAYNPGEPDPCSSHAPYRVFNIGNSQPTALLEYIQALADALGRKARLNLLPMQPGDVQATAADTSSLRAWVGFEAQTSMPEGIRHFARWYQNYAPS